MKISMLVFISLIYLCISCGHAEHVQFSPGQSGIIEITKDHEKSRKKAEKLMGKNCGADHYRIDKEGTSLAGGKAVVDKEKPMWQIKYSCTEGTARAKSDKPVNIPWQAVQISDEEPKNCNFIQKLEAESMRIFFTVSNKKLNKKNEEKLKKEAAKVGANTIFIIQNDASTLNASSYAKAYLCNNK